MLFGDIKRILYFLTNETETKGRVDWYNVSYALRVMLVLKLKQLQKH